MTQKHSILKKFPLYIVALLVASCSLLPLAAADSGCDSLDFNGGSGTAADPWQVNTAAQLDNVRDCLGSGTLSYYFVQTANINLGVAPYNQDTGWTPLGNSAAPFYGFYDGAGHTISGLDINQPTDATTSSNPAAFGLGLFGYTQNATIMNLAVTGASLTGSGTMGGLIGSATGTNIYNSSAAGSLEGRYRLGGLAGFASGGTIFSSHSGINIKGDGSQNTTGSDPTQQSYQQGGLVGYLGSNGAIIRSYASGNISGYQVGDTREQVGGLVGGLWGAQSSILDSYATGAVDGGKYSTGGLVGRVGSSTASINNSFATGAVTGVSGQTGGLVGGTAGTIAYAGADNFWDEDTTTLTVSGGTAETGETTAEMKDSATFTAAGWDFDAIWTIDSSTNGGYPFLQPAYAVVPIAAGNGTISPSTMQIAGAGQSLAFTMTPASGYGDSVSGTCSGTLSAGVFTTDSTNQACTVIDSFPPNTYSVTFDTQGGSSVAPLSQAYTGTISLPAAPTRAHYTFTGWNTAADGSGTSYNAGDSFSMPLNGTTLYAQWSPQQYSLQYSAGSGGSVTGSASQTVTYGADGAAITAVPDAGYKFTGWSDGVTANPRTDRAISQDISVTAEFAPLAGPVSAGPVNKSTVTSKVAAGQAQAAQFFAIASPTASSKAASPSAARQVAQAAAPLNSRKSSADNWVILVAVSLMLALFLILVFRRRRADKQ
ncbi:MAG TPA: InlB B-repeat-containing protein [Candidatus Saccharimonadales bacterium]|nr:InlB B-repeat-containing protein [Candidatus Saccharimonadales bacterium]